MTTTNEITNSQNGFCQKLGQFFKKHNLIFLVGLLICLYINYSSTSATEQNFDHFIFSQRWLPTSCISFKDKSNGQCQLPPKYKFWVIHGLWPQNGEKMGPFFCNKSAYFDDTELEPIKSELIEYWPNIEKDKGITSLWKHEWLKHGSCAAELESLNSEVKYFNTTLSLFKKYNMNTIMERINLFPSGDSISYTNLLFNLKNIFGKNCEVQCFIEEKTKRVYLSEIRICFSKSFEVINCHQRNVPLRKEHNSGFYSSRCPVNSKIIYPDSADPPEVIMSRAKNERMMYYNELMTLLSLLKFIRI